MAFLLKSCIVPRNPRLVSTSFPPSTRHVFSLYRSISALAILEQNNGQLDTGSLSTVKAAQKLGGPVSALVAGLRAKAVAVEAAKIKGVDKVIYVENVAYENVPILTPSGMSLC